MQTSAKSAIQLSKNYLSRYLHDVGGFLLAFAVAGFCIFPMVAITYHMYLPLVYLFVAFIGVPLIFVIAAVSSIYESYRYKFFVFVLAALLLLYGFREELRFDPASITPGAMNWNRIIFAQLLFVTPIIYGFRERHRMMVHWKMRASWE